MCGACRAGPHFVLTRILMFRSSTMDDVGGWEIEREKGNNTIYIFTFKWSWLLLLSRKLYEHRTLRSCTSNWCWTPSHCLSLCRIPRKRSDFKSSYHDFLCLIQIPSIASPLSHLIFLFFTTTIAAADVLWWRTCWNIWPTHSHIQCNHEHHPGISTKVSRGNCHTFYDFTHTYHH